MQFGGVAGAHDPAGVEDDEPVGQPDRDVEILLDEEHGQPGGVQAGDGLLDLLDDRRLDALGGLVEEAGGAG